MHIVLAKGFVNNILYTNIHFNRFRSHKCMYVALTGDYCRRCWFFQRVLNKLEKEYLLFNKILIRAGHEHVNVALIQKFEEKSSHRQYKRDYSTLGPCHFWRSTANGIASWRAPRFQNDSLIRWNYKFDIEYAYKVCV